MLSVGGQPRRGRDAFTGRMAAALVVAQARTRRRHFSIAPASWSLSSPGSVTLYGSFNLASLGAELRHCTPYMSSSGRAATEGHRSFNRVSAALSLVTKTRRD